VAGVAALLAALTAGDGLGRAGNGRTVADRADSRRAETPEAAASRAGALERFARRPPVTGVAQVPVAELDRCAAPGAGRVRAHSGGSDRPRAAFGSSLAGLAGTAGCWAGAVSDGTTPMAAIGWDAAIAALQAGEIPCSGGERRVLMLSASLAGGIPVDLRDAATGLDDRNVQRLVTAILHASGKRPEPGLYR